MIARPEFREPYLAGRVVLILDYTSAIEERSEELQEDYHSNLSGMIQTGFFADVAHSCRYCAGRLDVPLEDIQDGGGGYDSVFRLLDCPTCGWWYQEDLTNTYLGGGERLEVNKYRFAVLRRYDPAAIDVPLSSLRAALSKRPELMREISPGRLERLAGDVFRDHMGAEVTHLGGTGDEGIDLLLVEGQACWVVQVKRRMHSGRAEGVAAIRELIGAMTLQQRRQGIFFTTADRYTRGARKAATRAVEIGAVDSMDLVDFPRFADMLDLTFSKTERPWEVALDDDARFVRSMVQEAAPPSLAPEALASTADRHLQRTTPSTATSHPRRKALDADSTSPSGQQLRLW